MVGGETVIRKWEYRFETLWDQAQWTEPIEEMNGTLRDNDAPRVEIYLD
jgi:hypothetical protein